MASLKFINNLNAEQIEFFKKFSEEHVYTSLTQIIYKGQIPMAAYVLLEGNITLKDAQKRTISECTPGTMIGFSEIFEDKPFKYTAEISPNSTVLILPRSVIFEIEEKCNELEICPKENLSKITSVAV